MQKMVFREPQKYMQLQDINEKSEKEYLVERYSERLGWGKMQMKMQEISCTLHEKHMLETMFISAYENSNEVNWPDLLYGPIYLWCAA